MSLDHLKELTIEQDEFTAHRLATLLTDAEPDIWVDARIGEYPDGTRKVQGGYAVKRGFQTIIEWRDLPVIKLDIDGCVIE
jgi:hypothetical protein